MRRKPPVVDFKKAITMEYPTEYYVALLFGLFFLVVSVQKLINPLAFATAIFRGHVMPYPLVNIAALLLMSLEFVAAFAVVFMSQWRRAGLWILVSVLLIYTGCVGINLLRDLNTVCGCFGSGARATAISHWMLVKTLSIILAGLFALR
jgi:hypothetical protein